MLLHMLPGTLLYLVQKHDQTSADNDLNLKLLLQRRREKQINLDKERVQLKESAINFPGLRVTRDGLLPDPAKIDTFTKLQLPTSAEEVQRFCLTELPGKISGATIFCHGADPTTETSGWSIDNCVHDAAFAEMKQLCEKRDFIHSNNEILGTLSMKKCRLMHLPDR